MYVHCVFLHCVIYVHGISQKVQPTSTVHGFTIPQVFLKNQPPNDSMRNVLVNVTYGIINIYHHSPVSSQMH